MVVSLTTATVFVAALTLAVPVVHAQTAPAAATAPAPSADQLEDRIETKWKSDSALNGTDIDVEVKDGVATLTGEVHTAAQKARAARHAHVDGVTQVVNQIEVVRPGETAAKAKEGLNKAANKTGEVAGTAAGATREGVSTAATETKKGVTTAAEKTGEGVSKAGEKTGEALSKAGEKTGDALGTAAGATKGAAKATGKATSDGWLTTKVKSKFVGDKLLKGSDISVSTTAGVVTLTGTVPTEAGRDRAIALVKDTKGTKDVVDQLTIGPKTDQ
jgi:osmotically-inducible protein OsmY